MIIDENKIRRLIRRILKEEDEQDSSASSSGGSLDIVAAAEGLLGDEGDSGDSSGSGGSANISAVKGSYPKENIEIVIDALKEVGFNNDNAIMGILSVIAKESGFVPKGEVGYKNTSISRIREVFGKNTIRVNIDGIKKGTKFKSLSDSQINSLKSSNEKFFNALYGGRIGNNKPGDGWRYRGRGFNQLTGRANYRKAGYENNPDAVNNVKDAAKVVAKFFKEYHNNVWSFEALNGAKTPEEGTRMAADKNGGRKNKTSARNNALARLPHFKSMFKK
jgi:predicted chitinase